ncbi:MAG: response regulator [Candidatus Omnitrophica bacterium]|nr:response regulator [Candidatus Omnitrophota bacterium]
MKTKILLVDDEPDVLEILSKKLQAAGFLTVTASDGIQGLKKSREEKPDLVLLDIIMPNKDGFTMLRELQSETDLSRIPVIMVSAKSEADSLFEGRDLGATDYLIKPIDFDELLRYIKKYTLAEPEL